jgi:small-conductance mechanosensitive channel
MAADKRILSYPSPVVIFQQFSSSSIDIKLYFWCRTFSDLVDIKSDLITAIDRTFKENGIEIPFPQQDLHIRTVAEQSELISRTPDPKQ